MVESRWILLGQDGRHVSLGRHSDPSEAELAQAETALAASGQAGWLAVMRGDYYARRGRPELLMVKPLCGAAPTEWEAAVECFEGIRRDACRD